MIGEKGLSQEIHIVRDTMVLAVWTAITAITIVAVIAAIYAIIIIGSSR